MPCGARQAEYDVMGGHITRGALGEVPGGRWVRTPTLGFASNALYNFSLKDGALRATIARASRYACDLTLPPEAQPWIPAVDTGELRFKFVLSPGDEHLPVLARQLEEPPVVMAVPAAPGDLPRTGSLMQIQPATMRVVSFKADQENGWLLYLQEMNGQTVTPRLKWMGQTLKLGKVEGGRIAAWRLVRREETWQAEPITLRG
jgi:alpha-mannosidase